MKKTMRTIVFSIVLAAMTLTANNLNAQNGGGMFGRGVTESENASRTGESFILTNGTFGENNTPGGGDSYSITNETFGENTSPVGSGLGILLAAGLGYVALKKKED